MGKARILILGGTTEARALATALASRADLELVLSLAGRTTDPAPQPVPVRSGGFGGAEGLARYIRDEKIDLLIDATHPFAARISANAAAAAAQCHVSALALRRPAWVPVEGDDWLSVHSVSQAIAALGEAPLRVFLATGRQEAHQANAAPQHHYWVRSVDPVEPPLTVPHVSYIHSRGPFRLEDELQMLRQHQIEVVVAKNSGGDATYGKIEAARQLGIKVIMVERAEAAGLPVVETVEAALGWIDHFASSLMKRGV
ncbi:MULTISPECIES: cobalt-precorrin-6A reductase [Rhizobium]|uniref:Cobalt-precorrin-6A reductase n=1 Tax=Rhizobium tropici TaxID=398 RepID=A0A6P1CC25_RHITR|nr:MULTISPECIES: cobalt-precorrin-6A reductase [Rhizobium]AGB75193.1 precorrin-6x reductase [Rhizobium tropici CIAT 899]MBB4242859.1 precorrin-6A/cobalt-precorrin-6A reductase [Rhizobium tropici]MBB5594726.1 precorrin-6A/cobalt-precorrin-6A reductase [Rhizobium tropici]MBB6493184.1 precorrin-6A/cobalt-precorrin-6A reductase [Rhizobium tropici]NEV13981.1 cobalt-precorrin-6A reductase [Rhizobium tropici]